MQQGGKRFRNGCGFFAQRDTCLGAYPYDSSGLQSGDLGQGLGVEQQQDAGDPVGKTFGVTGEEFFEPREALILGDRRDFLACRCSMVTEVLILLRLAQTKNVRIRWRVVGPEARYSSTSCWLQVEAVRA